jgi:hypothetical protein
MFANPFAIGYTASKGGEMMTTRFKAAPPSVLLAAIFLFFSILYFSLRLFGYTLVPNSRAGPTVLSTVITGAMVWLTVKGVKARKSATKLTVYTSALLPPLAVIFCVGKDIGYDVGGIEVYTLTVYAYISMICAMTLFFTNVKSLMFRYIAGIIYCVLIVIFSFGLFVQMALWNFDLSFEGHTVLRSELSPNGDYLAEVIESSQGALSGSYYSVTVTRQKEKNILIGTLRKDPKKITVSSGTVDCRWETDTMLIVRGEEYVFK